ncbi:serine O-acetyltransferase [Arthrobacter sp. CAN_A212]|uniref:serine O-acetyltransferase n=1 Tax=unclassified Arthrobacter TaxID=235627 RepID=UPI0018C9FF47|nr:hypothetical protein [Arthrobacter sp. CAN_C5]MBP2216298.1 serine O-acetyltransferase [Arthrobacter sp. CAN_C5]
MKVTAALENFFQLSVAASEGGTLFAYYLLRGDEVVEKTPYVVSNTYKFPLDGPGTYRVKCYTKSPDSPAVSAVSDRVRYVGFPDVPRSSQTKSLSLVGLTKTSAAVSLMLGVNHQVVSFIDPSGEHVGSHFFGKPVVAAGGQPQGSSVIGHEAYGDDFGEMQQFSLANGSIDLLSKELHRFGVMDLYRLSRKVYLEGLVDGAYYIQTFIFNKFNSRVPFKARIGEGTRLGIGGIGTVIHPDSIIGRDCVIAQNVTLGGRVRGNGTPIVGDNVFIAPGAKCFGGRIGSNVVIGANAVVLEEVPDNCVVAGVPARIISTDIKRYTDYTARPPR